MNCAASAACVAYRVAAMPQHRIETARPASAAATAMLRTAKQIRHGRHHDKGQAMLQSQREPFLGGTLQEFAAREIFFHLGLQVRSSLRARAKDKKQKNKEKASGPQTGPELQFVANAAAEALLP